MKKLLYGSTALMAAGMLASGASAAEKIQVGVGGYFNAFAVYIDQDDGAGEPGANRRDHTLQREGEIIFNGKTTLDNGLEVGVQVQLEAETCGDQIDESFIWFEGGWGRVNIGAENSAQYLMLYGAPTAILGWGVLSPNMSAVQAGTNLAGNMPLLPVQLSGDAEKLTYFTPRIAGFQLGVSYTPDGCEENGGSQTGVNCGGQGTGGELDNNNIGEIFELGVNYVQKFGAFNVAVSGGYGVGQDETNTPTSDDPTEWHVGANLGWGGFTVGASWIEREDVGTTLAGVTAQPGGGGNETRDYTLGVRYATGPWGVGITYGHREVDVPNTGGEDEVDLIEVGASYALGPGVDLSGGVQWVEIQDGAGAAAAENEGLVFILGTVLSF